LDGFGVYIFNIDGALTTGDNADVTLINGANAANVYWNVGTTAAFATGSDFAGNVMAGDLSTMGSASTLLGKLLSQSGPVVLNNSLVVDGVPGFAPTFVDGTPADGASFTVCVGDNLTYTVNGLDPDGGSVALSVAGKPVGASQLPNDGGEDAAGPLGDDLLDTGVTVSSRFSWSPQPEDGGSYTLVYSLTDANGVVSQNRVTLSVSQRPAFVRPPTPAEGFAVTLCPGQAFNYTIAAVDADAGDAGALALEVSGAPAGLTHSPSLPFAAAGSVSTDAAFTPSIGQAGQVYTVTYTATDGLGCEVNTSIQITVGRMPLFEAPTPANEATFTVCAGDSVNYQVRAADGDAGQLVTISATGVPAGATHVDALPVTGNAVQTAFSWTPTADDAGVYVITYTATDNSAAACSSQTTVTVVVLAPVATSVTLTRTGTVAIDSELCYTALVRDQCSRPLPGQSVIFDLAGTTGNNQKVALVTDAAGQARLCFTPKFPGTDTLLVWADLNGNELRDSGEPMATQNVTVLAPVSTVGGAVAGSGSVSAVPLTPVPGESGTFFIDASAKRNGAVRGTTSFSVALPNFLMKKTKLTSLTISESSQGRSAVIFGLTTVKRLGGRVRFRVDVLDAGTPGVPNDQYFISFLTPTGVVTAGSNLRYQRFGPIRLHNDVLVRVGLPTR
ncbi:MAG: ice-binding family protein, partial [Actinomycetota bacterium]